MQPRASLGFVDVRRDRAHGDCLGLRACSGETVEQGEAFEVAACGKNQLDIALFGRSERILCTGPEQMGVLRQIGFDFDRPRPEICKVEPRVVDARDALVLGKPAREGHQLLQVQVPAEVVEHRCEFACLLKEAARSARLVRVDFAR